MLPLHQINEKKDMDSEVKNSFKDVGKLLFRTCVLFMCMIMLVIIVSFFETPGFENGGIVQGKEYIEPDHYYDGFIEFSNDPAFILKIKGDDGSIGKCHVDSITFMKAEMFKKINLKNDLK